MTHPFLSLGIAPNLSLFLVATVPAALAVVLTAWTMRRRTAHSAGPRSGLEIKVAALAAMGCTAYSGDTSWRFAADHLDMAGTAERATMFAAAELALFASSLLARKNMASLGSAGLPGALVWAISAVQVIPAYAESGPVGGTVRAFIGPFLAGTMWHLAMGIELRLRTPDALLPNGLVAILRREIRERLLSRLGIATRDRDAAQITRDRATTRAVALAARLAERTPERQRSWHGRRLTRRLSKAVGAASVGTDPLQRAKLLDQLAARRHALALATVPLPSPWSQLHGTDTAAAVPSPEPLRVPVSVERRTSTPGNPVEGKETWETAGTEPAGQEPGKTDASAGTGIAAVQVEHAQQPRRGPVAAESGTEPTGDREPTDTGTEPTGDREPTDTGTEPTGDREPTDTGTEPTGDLDHSVPLRRRSTPRSPGTGKRSGRPRNPSAKRRPNKPEPSVDQLVEQVLPHVPALLKRDGNASLTRVQLREILRREDLKGGRNERLSLVLARLRDDNDSRARTTAG